MLKECVVLNGQIINIGEWDDQEGKNPLPEGAVIEERGITQNSDGGWVLATDYASLRRTAYPDYSPYDILDEILKIVKPAAGSKLEQIINERNAVKAQYPKT